MRVLCALYKPVVVVIVPENADSDVEAEEEAVASTPAKKAAPVATKAENVADAFNDLFNS